MPTQTSHAARGRRERELRIIAGRWRGRKFRFPALSVRPTPDRVRETLFNWLQPRLPGAHCLDLYAGSGALGLEALSRGAASVWFVDQQRAAVLALEQRLVAWQAAGWTVRCEQARQFLAAAPPGAARARRFDVVFLDPPFSSAELAIVPGLLDQDWLAEDARIYIEHARAEPLPALPPYWRELRAGSAGEVGYHLFEPGGGAGP